MLHAILPIDIHIYFHKPPFFLTLYDLLGMLFVVFKPKQYPATGKEEIGQ